MHIDEDIRLSLMDPNTKEYKENFQVDMEEQTKSNLNIAQSLLDEGKEVNLIFQTEAGVSIISDFVGM